LSNEKSPRAIPQLRERLAAPLKSSSARIGRKFGDLKIRPKLLVLHNLFFLVLAAAVYLTVIPLFEQRVESARRREFLLMREMMAEPRLLPVLRGMGAYDYVEGSAQQVGAPDAARDWMDLNAGDTFSFEGRTDVLYRKDPVSGLYQALRIPEAYYDRIVSQARYTLAAVLAMVYVLAILCLEFLIMPAFVYGRIRQMLNADSALLQGDRQRELIPEARILNDEIGQIMHSRNAAVAQLREQEDELEATLRQLESSAGELRQKNEELEDARERLLEKDRLASLGLLSASVAHELNTPLTVLQGSIEQLSERAASPLEVERAGRMLKMVHRLRRISESLVGFSRVRRETTAPVPLVKLVEEAWHLVSMDRRTASLRYVQHVPAEHVVRGNEDRLLQVFVNLLKNATQAAPEDTGEIRVRSALQTRDGRDWVLLTVEDNGPGIPAHVLPDIFDAFVSTRLDSNGTGLGLTVSEGIVSQHGGAIWAENCPEGGARLSVRLPRAVVESVAPVMTRRESA
jgi:signal transduction histidine kinase